MRQQHSTHIGEGRERLRNGVGVRRTPPFHLEPGDIQAKRLRDFSEAVAECAAGD